jgi:hypothetical protein
MSQLLPDFDVMSPVRSVVQRIISRDTKEVQDIVLVAATMSPRLMEKDYWPSYQRWLAADPIWRRAAYDPVLMTLYLVTIRR